MHYYNVQVLLKEVPGEISICFSICGCKLFCKGCHSPFLWNEKNGKILTKIIFKKILYKYYGYASCVLFMGGEWYKKELIYFLKYAQKKGYKTCLYTGEERIDKNFTLHLNWVKTGKWMPELGGLDSPITNQRFINLDTNKIANHLFLKTKCNDSINPKTTHKKNSFY